MASDLPSSRQDTTELSLLVRALKSFRGWSPHVLVTDVVDVARSMGYQGSIEDACAAFASRPEFEYDAGSGPADARVKRQTGQDV